MKNGRYHLLTKDLRDFVIQSIKEQHGWQDGNVEQLVRSFKHSGSAFCFVVVAAAIF